MTNVIACIDGTDVSPAVCDYAVWASLKLEAPLEFLHVLDKAEFPTDSNLSGNIGLGSREALLQELAELDEKRGKLALEQGKLMLDAAKKRAVEQGIKSPTSLQRHGSLLETLAEMEDKIRLLVLGKHEDHLGEHIGSRIESVVRTMHRPILITTPDYREPKSVMIAFDGSPTTRKGVELIATSPLFRGLPCHLLMIGGENSVNREQLSWAKSLLDEAGFETHPSLMSGEVEKVICDYRTANNIDMLIMGAYGHSVIRRFLVGSTTTSVIRNASVPVLLLR
ncbi:MAG: universal stress protein [Sedimenticola sp.]|nr:universal stress protein [Sedimenticola sp.]